MNDVEPMTPKRFSKIVEDDSFDKFRTLGLQQSKLFSWDRSAQEIENLLFK